MLDVNDIPSYLCHKTVQALKITALEFHQDGSATVMSAESPEPFKTIPGWKTRFQAGSNNAEDLGYLMLYKDGYQSWSPTKAFEEGYKRVRVFA